MKKKIKHIKRVKHTKTVKPVRRAQNSKAIKRTKRTKKPVNSDIRLTNKQFKDLDTAKCELYQVIQSLNGVVKVVHLHHIERMVALLDAAFKPAYKADEARHKAIQKEVARLRLEKTGPARFSVSESPLARICEGPVRFVRTSGWAQKEITYKSDVAYNPTYEDAFKAFKQSIEFTGDKHHVFFEGVDRLGATDNVAIYTLLSGS